MKRITSIILCILMLLGNVPALAAGDVMDIGDTRNLTTGDASTSYPPMGSVSRSYQWYSSDTSVVEIISRSGSSCTIRAKSAGTAVISNQQSMSYTTYDSILGSRYCYETGYGDSWSITVNPVDPTGISISSTLSVVAESSKTIGVTYTPSNAASTLTWSSSDKSVATVSNGKVTGVGLGTATITVKTANGISDTCVVTVTAPSTNVSSVTPADGSIDILKYSTVEFTYNKNISAGSSYSSVKLYDNTSRKSVTVTKNITEKTLTLTPSLPLTPGHNYTATVPVGGVKNAYDAKNTTSNTTTFIVKPVAVESVTPADGRVGMPLDTVISVCFDDEIQAGTNLSDIKLTAKKPTDTTVTSVAYKTAISGNTLTITPKAELDFYTQYTVTVPAGAVTCSGVASDKGFTASFKTMRNSDIVYPPEITVRNGVITIEAEENASIYYTLDGGNPKVSGELYTEPFNASTNNAYLRAIATRAGKISEEAVFTGETGFDGEFMSNFGGDSNDYYNSVATTTDGYVAVGKSSEPCFGNGDWEGISGNGGYDAIIVKYDTAGNVVWKKTFGGSDYDYYNSVATTTDGYVAVGEIVEDSFGTGDLAGISGKGGSDAIIVKYDTEGNVVWKKTFGGSDYDYYTSVAATTDGYVAVGVISVGSFGNGDLTGIAGKGKDDAIIVKYDTDGNIVWKKTFGGKSYDEYTSVVADSDGYVVVGYSYGSSFHSGDWEGVSGKGNYDAIIVKYDTAGNVVWKKNFGGSDDDLYKSVVATSDGYVAVGESYETGFDNYDWAGVSGKGESDAIIVKYDTDGNVVWKKNFGGSNDDYYNSVVATSDGYISVGQSNSETGDLLGFDAHGTDALVVKYDWDGNVISKELYGGAGIEEFESVAAVTGGCVIAGYVDIDSIGEPPFEGLDGKGSYDGIIVSLSDFSHEYERYISSEKGKVALSGKDSVTRGDDFIVPLYFTPDKEVTGVNVKVTYPEGFTYLGSDSDYEGVYFDAGANSVNISGDFSADGSQISAGECCVLARLKFSVDSQIATGEYTISIDDGETFFMDGEYTVASFTETEDYSFSVNSVEVKSITVSGETEITGETKYFADYFPENAVADNLVWSVEDDTTGTIDQNGVLTPLKNGNIIVTVTDSKTGLKNSLTVTATGIKSYINSLSTDVGNFAKEYSPQETERILYVPKGTKSIKLTAGFTGGSVVGTNGLFFNNVAKAVSIGSLPATVTLTKKNTYNDDCVYKITVAEIPEAKITADATASNGIIQIQATVENYSDAVIWICVYDGNKLTFINVVDANIGKTNLAISAGVPGEKVKIMCWSRGGLDQMCKPFEKLIK